MWLVGTHKQTFVGLACFVGFRVRLDRAVSIGRCSTSVKSLRRRFELQRLARPSVLLACHPVEVRSRVYRQVSSLGEVLFEQAIRVLIGSALPRTLRIAEVDIDIGRQAKPAMIREFLATVPSQGFIQFSR